MEPLVGGVHPMRTEWKKDAQLSLVAFFGLLGRSYASNSYPGASSICKLGIDAAITKRCRVQS
jgi:hypothetical protein